MAAFGRQWNAKETLNIEDLFTCVGYAPSKGRKCQNPIAAANREWASNILHEIESMDVTTTGIRDHLKELAPRILCKRYHQGQASRMVSQWQCQVESLKSERLRQQTPTAVSTQISSRPPPTLLRSDVRSIGSRPTSAHRSPATTAAHSTPPPPTQLLLPSPPSTPIRRQNQERLITSSSTYYPSPPQTPSPTTPSIGVDPIPPTPEPAEQTPPSPSPPPPPPPSSSRPPASSLPSPPSSPVLNPTNLHTNSSTEECSICYEPVSRTTGISSHCEHLFHATCINRWFDSQDASLTPRARECPYCRSEWPRRRVEGDCSICLENLAHHDGDDEHADEEQPESRPEPEPEPESSSSSSSTNAEAHTEPKLVWCKSRCGQNFHRGCMSRWLAESATRESGGRCPGCRAEWVA